MNSTTGVESWAAVWMPMAPLVAPGPRVTKAAAGRREVRAGGRLVTPGWVDIHTHYDGQATWDPVLEPSASHGVTTIVATAEEPLAILPRLQLTVPAACEQPALAESKATSGGSTSA